MTAAVIRQHLFDYSQRMAIELGLSTRQHKFKDEIFQIPFAAGARRYVVLVPMDILRTLPVAHDWSDIDIICAHNETLRRKVNRIIGTTWRYATRRATKYELRRTLLDNPGALRDLLDQYKEKPGAAYDFRSDPDGEVIWHAAGHEFSQKYPLDLS